MSGGDCGGGVADAWLVDDSLEDDAGPERILEEA